MLSVFGKKFVKAVYYDGLSLADGYETRSFTAMIEVQDGMNDKAVQGGRIISFMLWDAEDAILCLYEKGNWTVPLDENDGVAAFARSHFLSEYNSGKYKSQTRASLRYLNAVMDESSERTACLPVPERYTRKKHSV